MKVDLEWIFIGLGCVVVCIIVTLIVDYRRRKNADDRQEL